MKIKIFTDVYKGMNPQGCTWYSEDMACRTNLCRGFQRVWATIDFPSKEQLWPEDYAGYQIEGVSEVEIPHGN